MPPVLLTPAFGLTWAEARQRLERKGLNALPQTESRRFHRIVTEINREPIVTLLLGCGAIYFVLGDSQEASLGLLLFNLSNLLFLSAQV